MKRQIHFRPQAEDEVLEAQRWYEKREPGLGGEFSNAVSEVVSRLAKHPLAFPLVRSEIRRAVHRRFPYAVYFRTFGDGVIVLSVHGRQDPRRWQARS